MQKKRQSDREPPFFLSGPVPKKGRLTVRLSFFCIGPDRKKDGRGSDSLFSVLPSTEKRLVAAQTALSSPQGKKQSVRHPVFFLSGQVQKKGRMTVRLPFFRTAKDRKKAG